MNIKTIKNFFPRISYFFPYLFYSILTFFIWYKTKFDVTQFVPDFNWYFSYGFHFWGDLNSDLSTNIFNNINTDIDNWQPNPLYPIVFLSPIHILGSKEIFAIEGFLIGIGCIFLVSKILSQLNNEINERVKILSLIAFSISPIMLTNTIALSTNGVFGFFF